MDLETSKTVVIPQSTASNPDLQPITIRMPPPTNIVWHWILSALVAICSLASAGYMSYSHNLEDLRTRMVVVETQNKNYGDQVAELRAQVSRMDAKIDELLLRFATAVDGRKP